MVTRAPGRDEGTTSTFPVGTPPSSEWRTFPRSSDARAPARVTVPPTAGTISPTAPPVA